MKASTGLRNYMLDTGSMKAGLAGGFLKIYKGAVPADADAAATGTLVLTVSVNSDGVTGLSMAAAAAAGVLAKAAEVWSGVVEAGGPHTAAYFRFVTAADDGTLSTTQRRLQGTIGTAGADMNLASTELTSGATRTIDYFNVALPTA